MFQNLANEIGKSVRRAERAARKERAKETTSELANLHLLLGQAYAAAVHLGAELDWNEVSGQTGAHTDSGGTPKGPAPQFVPD